MTDPGVHHLLGRVAVVRARVAACVGRRRETDPGPDDPFRGLYLSDDHVDRLLAEVTPAPLPDAAAGLLAEVERRADADQDAGADLRLRRLARAFELDPLDVELLVVALAPDINSGFEQLYGYLNDDVTRRRATIGLAIELCGHSPVTSGRGRLSPGGPLVAAGLILVEEPERPFLTRSLRVPDRVTAHLLGDDEPDPMIQSLLSPYASAGAPGDPRAEALTRSLEAGVRLCYLRERPGGAARTLAANGLAGADWRPLALDLDRMSADEDVPRLARIIAREARLRGAGLVVGPLEALAGRGASAVRAVADQPSPTVLVGRCAWDPDWSTTPPLLVDVDPPGAQERARMWRGHLDGDAPSDTDRITSQYALSPEQVRHAVQVARQQALAEGVPPTAAHLRRGARIQTGGGLERLTRRITPAVSWNDLVLPPTTLRELRELADRARHRDQVLRGWAMRPGGGRGYGIAALFAGDSGTGKTMSAEVIAAELGLDLYAVNLATVVDKYVGETEKNLERIFTEAVGVGGVLLFDEADAIFGKRSNVHSAHDRYANVETAYLLQRMESFDGLAILATNLRANVDDAFTRRLDAVVDFPAPDESHRHLLWERCLAPAPQTDLDLDFCGASFELSGGNIRSIAVTAAYLAAAADRPVSMSDLIRAVQREYRKLGRLCLPAEFGPYHALLD